jgi:hypothetical protein
VAKSRSKGSDSLWLGCFVPGRKRSASAARNDQERLPGEDYNASIAMTTRWTYTSSGVVLALQVEGLSCRELEVLEGPGVGRFSTQCAMLYEALYHGN